MDADDDDLEPYDGPKYRLPETIAQSELRKALDSLALFGSDPNFRNQAFNIALVDEFVMKLELNLLRQQFQEERTPSQRPRLFPHSHRCGYSPLMN